jgi:hypothetical protein
MIASSVFLKRQQGIAGLSAKNGLGLRIAKEKTVFLNCPWLFFAARPVSIFP